MYQIEELPDLKVAWHESYKCLNEPLLEYVWEVANHFLPDYAETVKQPCSILSIHTVILYIVSKIEKP